RELLRAAGEELGRGLANLVSILNPQLIVISGGAAGAGEWLLAPARRELRRWAQPLAARQVRVVRSRLGPEAALLGAARLALTAGAR
ncbi:MAG: ROK family protein, partial [Terriglobales bacterium]